MSIAVIALGAIGLSIMAVCLFSVLDDAINGDDDGGDV